MATMTESSSVPVQRYQGVQKESAGYRLLTSMGWKEGEGLGASKQGIKEHIRVKKNYENWGVGAVTAADRARDWSKGMMDFHRVLSNLSEITSQHATVGDQGDSDEESDASDAEAKHGSNKGTILKISKKKDKKEKKKKKKSKKKGGEKTNKRKRSSQSSDQKSDSDDGSETKLERSNSESVKRVKFATHVGRFKKRENAKMVKNYSHNDLAAILGCGNDAFPSFPDALGPTAPPSTESSADEAVQSQNDSDDDVQRQIQDKVLVGVTNQNTNQFNSQSSDKELQIEVIEPANVDASSSLQQEADLWWSNYFCRSGRIGSSSNNTTVSRPRGFSENDQTSLYAAVQGGATQGRMGLGRSSMPKKVGGARWAGKKVRLDNDSDDEDIAKHNADSYEKNQLEENKHDSNNILNSSSNTITIIHPRKKSNDGPASKSRAVERCNEGAKEVNDDNPDSQSTSNKWKGIVKQVLAGFDKDIKFKKLVKTILENHNMEDDTKEEIEIAVASVLQSSSKFAFDGKKIKHIKAK